MSKAHFQDKRFMIRGQWWLPGGDRKVAGDLVYKRGDVELRLYGGLNEAQADSPFSATPEELEFPVIHGESLRGVPITVLDAYYTKWTPDIRTLAIPPGTRTAILASRIHCRLTLTGIHLSSQDDGFLTCRIQVPDLEHWLGDRPFAVTVGKACKQVAIQYTRPEDEQFEIEIHDCIVKLVRSVRLPGAPSYNAGVGHLCYVEVAALTPKPAKWFLDRSFEIVDLLSVLYGGNLLSRRLTLFGGASDHDGASVYYPRHNVKVPGWRPMDFMVRYDKVRKSFGRILQNWLAASERETRARRMLLSSTRRPPGFIELRFLPLVHAAEVLSNESAYATIVDQNTFDSVRSKMLAAIADEVSPELIESIKNGLGHANGHNLRRKVLDMLGALQDDIRGLFCVDASEFVRGLVKTRNHYTHYSTKPGERILQRMELHWAIQKTALMLRMLLLLRAGMDEDDLRSAIQSHHRLSRERAVWRTITERGSLYNGNEW